MGGGQSRMDAERYKGAEVIDCGSFISVADINRVLSQKPNLSPSSRNLFRKAANCVARSDDYIMRNCEIRLVDGNDLYLIFFAGNAANKYLVIVNDNAECEEICKEKSFSRIIWEGAYAVYTRAWELTGPMLNALTYTRPPAIAQ